MLDALLTLEIPPVQQTLTTATWWTQERAQEAARTNRVDDEGGRAAIRRALALRYVPNANAIIQGMNAQDVTNVTYDPGAIDITQQV